MKAIRQGRSAAVSTRRRTVRHHAGLRPRGRAGATLLLSSALALLLTAALVGAAPARAARPQGSPQESLALLALQQTQLTAPDGAASDWFGFSVALSGDTALVGAELDAVGAHAYQGSAYVFTRTGTIWTLQQHLTAGDGDASDGFGWAVALSGDTALIAAPYADIGANTAQGAAYVFARSGTTWTQQQKLTAGDGDAMDEFGYSVAVSGDTSLVGARWDDLGTGTRQGSAYVFTRSGTTWTQQGAALTADDGATDDEFGSSVALSGDTALVGAPYADIGANTAQGSAYVFTRSGAAWTFEQKLIAGDGDANDCFGWAVALSGDTALIAAPWAVVGEVHQGSAYAFVRSGTTWTRQAQLTAADGAFDDEFGSSVALSGDAALVGGRYHDVGTNTDQGTAYAFARSGTTWTRPAQLTAADGASDDEFGSSVALSGDTALVGALHDDVGANTDQGSAYVFLLDGVAPVTTASFAPPANAAGWRKNWVTVTLGATDDLTGVASSAYRSQGAATWTPYTEPFQVKTQGASTWKYRSSDLAGNVETAKSFTVRIDTRKPTTKAYAAAVKKGKTVKLAYKVLDAKPGCGQAAVTLTIYKGKKLKKTLKAGSHASNVKRSYSWLCTLAKGKYTLRVYATDIAGNVQSTVGSARLTVK